MAKQAWESIVAFKLVWVRVMIYVVIPIGTTFLALTKGMADADWMAMGMFTRFKLYIECLLPGLLALAAFIDQSLARAKADHEKKRNGSSNTDTGP